MTHNVFNSSSHARSETSSVSASVLIPMLEDGLKWPYSKASQVAGLDSMAWFQPNMAGTPSCSVEACS